MLNSLIFWDNKKAEVVRQRLISNKRIRTRKVKVSGWAGEAQKCEIAIAEIDKQLSKLNGPFVRAQRERLESSRLIWQGRLNQALVQMKRQKTLLAGNIKHNEALTAKRSSI